MFCMLKVIIAGGRTFDDYALLRKTCLNVLSNHDPSEIEIVSGGAEGADKLGEWFAEEFGYSVTKFPADWGKYGRLAGPMRNEEMANYADGLIAFDTGGRGTKSMIGLANKYKLLVRVIDCTGKD